MNQDLSSRLWRPNSVGRSISKANATDSIEPAAVSSPLHVTQRKTRVDIKGVWAADKSCEAPPGLYRLSISSPAFLLFDCSGNSVPPKEPPLLRCKAPPPKRLATVVSEPDPKLLLTFYGLALVVQRLSNDCASKIAAGSPKVRIVITPAKWTCAEFQPVIAE
jgi:hypothetical protein